MVLEHRELCHLLLTSICRLYPHLPSIVSSCIYGSCCWPPNARFQCRLTHWLTNASYCVGWAGNDLDKMTLTPAMLLVAHVHRNDTRCMMYPRNNGLISMILQSPWSLLNDILVIIYPHKSGLQIYEIILQHKLSIISQFCNASCA